MIKGKIDQAILDEDYTPTNVVSTDDERGDCGESVFVSFDAKTTLNPNAATSAWYQTTNYFDWQRHKPSEEYDESKALKAHHFTQLIWKSSTSIGFGTKDSIVVAWYCPAGNDKKSQLSLQTNVCPVGGCVCDAYMRQVK